MDALADLPQILRLLAALAFVIALMGGLAFILKKIGYSTMQNRGRNARLRVVEILPLDARRRAVLLQRDEIQHLVILGPSGETLIETGIKPVQSNQDDS